MLWSFRNYLSASRYYLQVKEKNNGEILSNLYISVTFRWSSGRKRYCTEMRSTVQFPGRAKYYWHFRQVTQWAQINRNVSPILNQYIILRVYRSNIPDILSITINKYLSKRICSIARYYQASMYRVLIIISFLVWIIEGPPPKKPDKKPDVKTTKSVKAVVSKHKISEECSGDYRQALDLVVECARLLYIRFLQAKLMKELIEVVYK